MCVFKNKKSWGFDSKLTIIVHSARSRPYCPSEQAVQSAIFGSFQNLLAGSNVADDAWHTVRFSRRASNLKLQVDTAAPVRGMLCTYARAAPAPFIFPNNL